MDWRALRFGLHTRTVILGCAFTGALALGGTGCGADVNGTSDEPPTPDETSGEAPSTEGESSTTSSAVSTSYIYWKGSVDKQDDLYQAWVSCDRGISCCVGIQWYGNDKRYHYSWWNINKFLKGEDSGCSRGAGEGKNEGVIGMFYNSFASFEPVKARAMAVEVRFENNHPIYGTYHYSKWSNNPD